MLAAQPRDGEYVFPNPKGEPYRKFAGGSINRVRRSAEIADFTTHRLRHTIATKLSELGVPAEHRSKVLNHAEGGVTEKYSHYDFDTGRRAALVKLARHLEGILGLAEDNVVAIA